MRKFLLLAALAGWPAFAQAQTARVVGADGLSEYQAATKKVKGGDRVVLVLGADDALLKPGEACYRYTDYRKTDELKGCESGVYECFLEGKEVKWSRRLKWADATPQPATAQPAFGGLRMGFQFTGPLGNTIGGGACVGRT
jgi:hypothetical protein